MARYIDANKLLGEFSKSWEKLEKREIDHINVTKLINEAPTADVVEVVHAFWEEVRTDYICSHCNTSFSDELPYIEYPYDLPKYCPECGAVMGGKKVE